MKFSREDILNELYAQDPILRQHEEKLKILLEQIIKNKPQINFNEHFRQELKQELLQKAQQLMINPKIINNNYMSKFSLSIFARSLSFTAAGLAVLVLLVASGLYLGTFNQRVAGTKLALNSLPEIKQVSEQAFGKLQTQAQTSGEAVQGLGAGPVNGSSPQAMRVSSSIEAPVAISDSKIAPSGFGGGGGMMPITNVATYVYKGEPLVLEADKVGVLKRIKNVSSASQLGSLMRGVDFGLVNFSKFTNIELQNLNFIENKDFGYNIYANLYDSSISISENWTKWPNPSSLCQDQACFDSFRLSINDVPADDEIISITNDFIKNYGIDVTSYGKPYVNNDWRVWYDQTTNKNDAYVPDILQVTYPLQIEGSDVYDESGNKAGLVINVNVRYKKVSGFWNLVAQTYEQSLYEAETDEATILKVAERGGVYGWQWDGADKVEVGLGTPTKQYIKMWNYRPVMTESDELYVPALVFPILDNPNNIDIYRKAVVVPLAKDLLQVDNGFPMPLAEPAVLRTAE